MLLYGEVVVFFFDLFKREGCKHIRSNLFENHGRSDAYGYQELENTNQDEGDARAFC